jgi:hypothetical protein
VRRLTNPAVRHPEDERSRPWFDREMRSGLRLILARRPDRRTPVYEALTFHCEEGLASWLAGGDDFDPEACPLRYRCFGSWPEAEGWLRDGS